jgi:hypothetical protein
MEAGAVDLSDVLSELRSSRLSTSVPRCKEKLPSGPSDRICGVRRSARTSPSRPWPCVLAIWILNGMRALKNASKYVVNSQVELEGVSL